MTELGAVFQSQTSRGITHLSGPLLDVDTALLEDADNPLPDASNPYHNSAGCI